MTTTYQLQARDMIRKHGVAEALRMCRGFARTTKDPESREFWKHVITWIGIYKKMNTDPLDEVKEFIKRKPDAFDPV